MHSFFVFVAGHCRRWLPHKVRLDFITAGVISDPEAASSLATALQNHKSAGCSILPLSVSSSPSLPLSLSLRCYLYHPWAVGRFCQEHLLH